MPSGLLEEGNEADLISSALKFYNQNIRIRTVTDDILFAICQVTNHKATLPVGFKQFIDVSFSDQLPSDPLIDSTTWFLQPDINAIYTTIFARTFWQYYKQRSYNTRYVGKDASIVHNDCVQYICDNCVNFSIDKFTETMTLDIEEGYVFLLYSSTMMDENGFYVPDHPVLWQALAFGIEAKHWQDRAFRRESGANETYLERMRMANNSIGEFLKIHLLTNFNPDVYESRLIKVRQEHQMSAERDNYNYKRR